MKGWMGRLQEMVPLYYRARGWDASGKPLPEKLLELGLSSED